MKKMDTMENAGKGLFAILTSLAIYAFGGIDGLIKALVFFLALDYITGCVKAWDNGELNSKKGLKGFLKKVGFLAVVAVANVLDEISGADGFIRNATIMFFIANEGLSIVENAAAIGVPLPKSLIEKLEQLRDKK